ncbi:MAG: Gfo/Idh/MocA family oxidoreductase [Thermodesulfovibrionia bacterium]
MIRVAVIGVGMMGSHHARVFSELKDVELVGVVDIDSKKAEDIARRYNTNAYTNHLDVIDSVDAVSIAVPTTSHFKVAMDFIRHGKDLLIEKPITQTLKEARILISEAEKRGIIMQIGHIERFNAGVSVISKMVNEPRFIESHRLSPFSGRGIDVDVTLDLMIHDIDIILSLVDSEIADIRATGARVMTDSIDVAHAWIEFENGCVAEAVTSRIAEKTERQLKVFQQNAFLNLNYQTQEIIHYKKNKGHIDMDVMRPKKNEPLKEQLISFIECVKKRTRPIVSGYEGKKALKVALKISELVTNEVKR